MRATAIEKAFGRGDYEKAEKLARKAGDQRAIAAVLLLQRRWDEAFALLDDALATTGASSVDRHVEIVRATDDNREAVLEEARHVLRWTSPTTPEWARVLGGMWQMFADDPVGPELERRFRDGLARLRDLDDLEVVIRQARERKHLRAANLAAAVGVERFPSESWIHSVYGNCLRDLGDIAAAMESYHRCLALVRDVQDRVEVLGTIAVTAAWAGQDAVADDALARARALADGSQARYEAFYAAERGVTQARVMR
jgi:tetratricopeptide (TPR) repeat protein